MLEFSLSQNPGLLYYDIGSLIRSRKEENMSKAIPGNHKHMTLITESSSKRDWMLLFHSERSLKRSEKILLLFPRRLKSTVFSTLIIPSMNPAINVIYLGSA